MPANLTKFLAFICVALAAALHLQALAPVWGVHPTIFAIASGLLELFGILGIAGPVVAPKTAAMLGNPPGVKLDAPPPPGYASKTGVVVLALVGALGLSACHPLPPQSPPDTSTGLVNCLEGKAHDDGVAAIGQAGSALVSVDWRAAIAVLVGKLGFDAVACAVQAISGSAQHNFEMTADPLEATKAANARTWLTEQHIGFTP